MLTILVPREIRLRYRENALDMAWVLITPVAIMAVYGVVLTQSFDVTGSCAPYLTTAWTGLVLWTFFASALGTGAWSLLSSSDLITKVYFPRESIPLSVVGASLLDLGVGAATILALAALQGVPITLTALAAVPALLTLVIWSAALSVLAAAIAVFIRDVTQAVQIGLRVGFFATPVMYEPDLIPDAFRWSATWNPVAASIQGVRDPVLCQASPDWGTVLVQFGAGVALLGLALRYVRSVEGRMSDVV